MKPSSAVGGQIEVFTVRVSLGLIAAAIPEEQNLMRLYQEAGGPSFEMWSIPEARHMGAFDLHPEEFERRVVAFFDAALLDAEPAAGPLVTTR